MTKITTIIITGMHCHSCKALIEDVCHDFPGVQSCTVDFKDGKAEIEHNEQLDWKRLKEEIEGVGGYAVELPSPQGNA